MKKYILLLTSIIIANIALSQCNGRYQTEIFNSVSVNTVNYSDVYYDNEHKMDIYTPDGDTETNRPVILYMHGGSFTAGNKNTTDCVDFCESFAKRGYVCASINYRLSDILSFFLSQDTQYETVLKAVADAKSAVRFFRRDFTENNNSYGIDENAIFVGGYSAGGVIAVHQGYIDDISELPTNIQALASVIGNNIEGDAGNDGYSSQVQGVISLAGGIHDVSWIDANDAPIASAQGTEDNTVNYNCGPGLNNPAILTLCGAGEIHPEANSVGIINDVLIFNDTDHDWGVYGNSSAKFLQAVNFFSDFLFPLLPCNNPTNTSTLTQSEKTLTSIVDILGRPTTISINKPLFYIYSDGTVEHKITIK